MDDISFSTRLITLNGHFNVNVAISDCVNEYISKMLPDDRKNLQNEYSAHIDNGDLDASQFYRATACDAKDEASARKFFEDVYKYAFEGGEEPDVTNYWNR